MSKRAVLSWLCLVIGVALMAVRCAAPPTDAMNAAEEAIQNARAGEADKYASEAFQKAVDEFNKAQEHMAAKEYGEARAAAEKTMELAEDAGKETGVGRELMKIDAEKRLDEFLSMWKGISKEIESKRGRAARTLAKEAGEYSEEISGRLNDLKGSQQWYELLDALEEANAKAEEFQQRVAGQ